MSQAEANPLFQRNCKMCGCPLACMVTADGKLIPLDLRAPVYVVEAFETGGEIRQEAVRFKTGYVSHFATCSHANQFSKGRREKEPQESIPNERENHVSGN